MAKKAAVIMPQTREILAQMGEQIRGSAEPLLYPLRKAPLRYPSAPMPLCCTH